MSIEVVGWALNVPTGGNAKVILLGLANHAHPDGTEAYPALDTLARYAHCDRSTARRNLRKLVEDGWITEDGFGPRGQNKYRLAIGGKTPPVALAPDGGGKTERGGVAPMPPEPSLEPAIEPSTPSQREGEENQNGGELLLLDAAEVQRPPRGRARRGAREGRSMTYEQKRVSDETVEIAERLLGTFNDATGSRLRAWKDSGRPSDHLRQIVGRVMAREGEASEQDWHRAIRNTVAAPPSWMEGPVTIGVIFGERASDHALANTGTVPIRASYGGNGRVTAQDFLALRGTLG